MRHHKHRGDVSAYLDLSAELQGCATWVLLLLQKKKGNREKRKDVKSGKDTEAHGQLERRDLNMVGKKKKVSCLQKQWMAY